MIFSEVDTGEKGLKITCFSIYGDVQKSVAIELIGGLELPGTSLYITIKN